MRSLPIIATVLLLATPAMGAEAPDHGPAPTTQAIAANAQWIAASIAAPSRAPENRARDRYRNPLETLNFFGIKPGDTIVELFPGGGWYTEILAPLSKAGGNTLYLAGEWSRLAKLQQWPSRNPDIYADLKFAEFPATSSHPNIPAGTADAVLTFRNVHNWRFGGAQTAAAAFSEIYAMLKPGGVLGVVEHRLNEDDDSAREEKSGYMKESSVIAFAEAAGFTLADRSEINANPKDKKDYPNGVWTLPPVLREKEVNRDQYLAIGESDRMTLKFIKPAQ